MHPDLFRTPLRPILAAIVPELADQFLLLGVDRDHWLLLGQSSGHLGVDMGELRIPVRVAVTLLGLAVSLQAVTRRIEQFAHQGAAHLVALLLQRFGQSSHAFAVHRNGDPGSPRVVGSTSASRSATNVGSCKPIFYSLKSRFDNFRTGPKGHRGLCRPCCGGSPAHPMHRLRYRSARTRAE